MGILLKVILEADDRVLPKVADGKFLPEEADNRVLHHLAKSRS